MTLPRRLAWLTALSLVPASLALPRPELMDAIARQRAEIAAAPTVEAWNDLGNLLVRQGSAEEAREAYRQALALHASSTLALYNLGLLELELGEIERAEEHFRRVLDIDPSYALAHYRLGDLYRQRDRNPRAVVHYAEAFRLAPELTLAETHPEVLSNPLRTWALMHAYLEPEPGRGARRYGNPGRIARLFVGEFAMPAIDSEEAAAEGEPISNDPAAKDEPMSPHPAAEGEPISNDPAAEDEPMSPHPAAEGAPISNDPAAEDEPMSPDPAAEDEPMSPDPAADGEPISNEPAAVEPPGDDGSG
jgi:tetratricopeptide (TPR) repeat protein